MTISSTTRVAGPFNGDGSTATFPFSFKVFAAADLDVVTLNTASGAITPLALTTDYTVSLNPDQDGSPGGSITLTAGGLAVGLTLTITTDMAATQSVNLANGGGFYPEVINAALDLLTILIQQLQAQQAQAIQVPFGDNASMELPSTSLRAGKMLSFDSAGNLSLINVTGGGNLVVGAPQTAGGTVNGSNTQFTFTAPSGPTPTILAFAGGVLQDGTTDYGAPVFVSGTTWKITFTAAPINGPVKVMLLD